MKTHLFDTDRNDVINERLFRLLFELQVQLELYRKANGRYDQLKNAELDVLTHSIERLMERIITET